MRLPYNQTSHYNVSKTSEVRTTMKSCTLNAKFHDKNVTFGLIICEDGVEKPRNAALFADTLLLLI